MAPLVIAINVLLLMFAAIVGWAITGRASQKASAEQARRRVQEHEKRLAEHEVQLATLELEERRRMQRARRAEARYGLPHRGPWGLH